MKIEREKSKYVLKSVSSNSVNKNKSLCQIFVCEIVVFINL